MRKGCATLGMGTEEEFQPGIMKGWASSNTAIPVGRVTLHRLALLTSLAPCQSVLPSLSLSSHLKFPL